MAPSTSKDVQEEAVKGLVKRLLPNHYDSFAIEVDPNFTVDKKCVFKVSEFRFEFPQIDLRLSRPLSFWREFDLRGAEFSLWGHTDNKSLLFCVCSREDLDKMNIF